jgi:signal peptidase II
VSATDPDASDAAPSQAHSQAQARPRRLVLFVAIALAVVVADIVSKAIVVSQLARPGQQVRLLGGAIYLIQTRNSGAAFSVATGATVVLTGVALVVVVIIVRAARRLRSIGWAVALGLILGGAIGNLIDRLFRSPGFGRGHVVDWISLFSNDGHIWPVFNLADSGVVCGAVTAAIVAMLGIEFDGTRRHSVS